VANHFYLIFGKIPAKNSTQKEIFIFTAHSKVALFFFKLVPPYKLLFSYIEELTELIEELL
jgi:hypothetical protein